MTDSTEHPHELRRLLTAMFDGALTDDDARRLEQVLSADATSRAFYRRYLELHAMLQFDDQPLAAATGEMAANETNLPRSAEEFLEHVRRASRQEAWQDGCVAEMASRGNLPIVPEIDAAYPGRTAAQPPLGSEPAGANPLHAFQASAFWFRPLVVFGAMILSALIGGAFVWQSGVRREVAAPTEDVAPHLDAAAATSSAYAATLVNVTNCRWDSRKGIADFRGGTILPGQSLNLLEGIAEIASSRPLGGSGRFVLEGPLAMVMTGDGTPALQYGKLFAAVDSKSEAFVLRTPLGHVFVTSSASIGLVAANREVTLHVFAGEAEFELLWAAEVLGEQSRFQVSGGSSLRLTTTSDSQLLIERGLANDRCFAINLSMSTDRLNVTDDYVSAIRRSSPLAYWRFESAGDGFVRNEMGDRWHCRVKGGVRSREYRGNRSLEFGVVGLTGYLLTDDDFGTALKESYALEAWVKPSHIHWGTLMALVDWSQNAPSVTRYGVMMALCGPAGPLSQAKPDSFSPPKSPMHYMFHPECIRFMHRNPVGDAGGTDCYSSHVYSIRKWQHIVTQKERSRMCLYVNGRLAAQTTETSDCPDNLRMLIGQLYPSGFGETPVVRQFVGELDEAAVYDRALSEDEIAAHFQLAQGAGATAEDDK